MFFRILCPSDLLDYIDGGVGSFLGWGEGRGVREEIEVQCRTCLFYDILQDLQCIN